MSGSAAVEEGADVTWLDGSADVTAADAATTTADDGSSFGALLFVLLDDAGDAGDAITVLIAAGPVVVAAVAAVADAAIVAILQPWFALWL